MYFVYILRSSKTGRRYVGSCQDVVVRLHQHNNGHSHATRHGLPWALIHQESFPTRAQAMARERYFKTGKGREELDALDQ